MGAKYSVRRGDHAIAVLGADQHGVVAHAQLAKLGVSRAAIEHRVATGRLHPLYRGVYAVGHRAITQEGLWIAAVLAAPQGAVLSHRSAAALWDLWPPMASPVEITIPVGLSRPPRIRVHESQLAQQEITIRKRIPTTSPARTLVDLAAVTTRLELSRAFREAEAKRLVTATELSTSLERHRGRRGIRALRGILADAGFGSGITRSELEARFASFLRKEGLAAPARNVHMRIGPLEVEADCVWPGKRLIVELDGRAFHDTATAFERDRARDRALAAHGWTAVRVTWRQLRDDQHRLEQDLRRLLQR